MAEPKSTITLRVPPELYSKLVSKSGKDSLNAFVIKLILIGLLEKS